MISGLHARIFLLSILLLLPRASWAQTQPAETQPAETQPAATQPADADAASADEPKLLAVSFRNVKMDELYKFYGEHLGKPVIPDDAVNDKKITIINDRKLPLSEALQLIGTALQQQGVIVRETPRHIEFLPIEQIRRISRDVVGPEESVTQIEDPSRIVDKVFHIQHYDVMKLKDVILPLLPDYAFVVVEPSARRLIVTDNVANLTRVEQLVSRMDIPSANQTVERILPLKHADAGEVVSMLRLIISGTMGDKAEPFIRAGSSPAPSGNRRGNRGNSGPDSAATQTVVLKPADAPVILHADFSRNWIFAVAPPAIMSEIERWVRELDVPKDGESEPFTLIEVKHADIAEVAQQISDAISNMPAGDIRDSVRVVPFTKSRQLLVYGSQRGRAMVHALLQQLDIESSQYQVVKEIALQHDTAENVKQKIEDLYDSGSGGNEIPWWYGYSSSRRRTDSSVKVTADTQRNTVTVMTDPARMARIEELIAEQWDRPINVSEAQPRVYTLAYADPVQVQELLDGMFNKRTTRSTGSWWDQTTETSTPVGRLFGQFSFEAMKDSNKLIVSTKSPHNYVVIDELIADLDTPQQAGLPVVVELKHANAEDVAEQLNAMFSEAGARAQIFRTQRGLSDKARGSSPAANADSSENRTANRNEQRGGSDPSVMSFWWAESNPRTDEQPTSTLIGKPRFVPVNRRNALMVLAPPAHLEPIRALLEELDRPGLQVVVHAIITEVQHDNETTLGLRLAADPSVLNDPRLADQAIGGRANAAISDTFLNGNGIFDVGFNVNVLLQLLMKRLNLKVLNEPRVYTADNQEAHFFDGQDVPVITADQTDRGDAETFNRDFEYRPVGTRLHVRPHITQEGEVALTVNLELSRIVSGTSVFGNFIFDRRETTTHVVVKDGQTMMISGIINKEDIHEVRKIPLLGDLPLLGGLFRSTDTSVGNREVIAFITPHVVRSEDGDAELISERNAAWLSRVRGAIDEKAVQMDPDADHPFGPAEADGLDEEVEPAADLP